MSGAYCGDVLFPALVLSQLMAAHDEELLVGQDGIVDQRHDLAVEAIRSSFSRRYQAPDQSFTVVHASRSGEGASAKPRLWLTSFNMHSRSWKDEEIPIAEQQVGLVVSLGSGSVAVENENHRWEASSIGGTSRAVYGAFCEALGSGADPRSGGAPQLASIYPRKGAVSAGVLDNDNLYLHGLPIQGVTATTKIEWFDRLFQRIDPVTLMVKHGAARHARPTLT